MSKINKDILLSLTQKEEKHLAKVNRILKSKSSSTAQEFFEIWKSIDREEATERMYKELAEKINAYWVNEKYNSKLDQEFNMLHLSHGGYYGGELEAYAISFNNSNLDKDIPLFELLDERFEYLDNIESHPAFSITPLLEFTDKLVDKEDEALGDDDVYELYTLYESTAFILAHNVIKKAFESNLFATKLKFQFPFYITMAEHDCGDPDQLIYIIE